MKIFSNLSRGKIYFLFSAIPVLVMTSIIRGYRVLLFSGILFLGCVLLFMIDKNIKININKSYFDDKYSFVLSLFIATCVFLDFFFEYSKTIPSIVKKLSYIDPKITISIIGIIGIGIGFFAIFVLSKQIKKIFIYLTENLKIYKKHYFIIFSICMIGSLSLIRANFNYIDDAGRVIHGYTLSGDFSRYMSDFLSKILHMNSWLADISPLPQILALAIMSLAGIIAISVITDNKKTSLLSVVAIIPMIINPYFIRCLAYKYDAPYMALSVLLSIVPLLFRQCNKLKYGIFVFISTILVCITYQSSLGIFPIFVIATAFLNFIDKRNDNIIIYILTSAFSYILGLVVFKVFLMQPITQTGAYINPQVSLNKIFINMNKYFNLMNEDLNFIWLLFIYIIAFYFIIYIVLKTKQNKLITLLTLFIFVPVIFSVSFGPYIIFDELPTDPRYMYCIGVLITIIGLPICVEKKYYLCKVVEIMISFSFVVYFLIFGNALSSQKEYADFRNNQIVEAINDSDILKDKKTVQINVKGTIGFSESVENMIEEYPILKKTIPVMLSDSSKWFWGDQKLRQYYKMNLIEAGKQIDNNQKLIIIKDTYFYKIKSNSDRDYLLIELK